MFDYKYIYIIIRIFNYGTIAHCDVPGLVVKISDTIKPYKPNTSAKIKIKIIPTYKRGC